MRKLIRKKKSAKKCTQIIQKKAKNKINLSFKEIRSKVRCGIQSNVKCSKIEEKSIKCGNEVLEERFWNPRSINKIFPFHQILVFILSNISSRILSNIIRDI